MTQMTLLHPGDPFPTLTAALPEGRALRLPDAQAGHYGVVLFYRGSWCPHCNAQLRAFQRSLDRLTDMDTLVIALSVDDETTTRDLIARHGLRFPVGHSADARAIATATGAFVNDDPMYLQFDRLRARPRRPGRGQRLFQRRHRTAGTRRRHRPDPLPTRTRPCQPIVISGANPAAPAADTQAKPAPVRRGT